VPSITLTLPTSGTVITAGLHANNYTSLQNLLNGGLDTANWAAGKIFAPSKFMQEAAALNQAVGWDGSQWSPGDFVRILDRNVVAVDVNNTAAETTVYTKSIAANTLGTQRSLRLTMIADQLHNNVAGDTCTLRCKYGGTTLVTLGSSFGGTLSAARRTVRLTFEIINLNATNSQNGQLFIKYDPTTGGAIQEVGGAGTAAVDSTAAQTLLVSAQWSAASLNDSFKMISTTLELV
jgi:hypothetical protein